MLIILDQNSIQIIPTFPNFIFYVTISDWERERSNLGLWLDRNSCPISALSSFHHCQSQQRFHSDSWEICSGVQHNHDECKDIYLIGYAVRGHEPWLRTSTEKDIVLYKESKLCTLWICYYIHIEFPPISFWNQVKNACFNGAWFRKTAGIYSLYIEYRRYIFFVRFKLKKKLFSLIVPGFKLYYELQV